MRLAVAAALLLIVPPCSVAGAGIELPIGDVTQPVAIRAGGAMHWRQGAYEVWVLRGAVQIDQGAITAKSDEAVLWVDRAEAFSGRPSKVIAYLEGKVRVNFGKSGDPGPSDAIPTRSLQDRTWLGRFHTTGGIELSAPLTGEPQGRPAIFERGAAAREKEGVKGSGVNSVNTLSYVDGRQPELAPDPLGTVRPAQFTREEIAPPAAAPIRQVTPSVDFYGRNGRQANLQSFNNPEQSQEGYVVNSGLQIIVQGFDQLGTVSIESDRAVVWTRIINISDQNSLRAAQSGERPIEVYLEGNIVFRQGDRVIYADRMYYNVGQESGVVLNAEMLTPVPEYQGLLRLKAEVLQQVNRQRYEAYNAALTSSRIGGPRYWFQTRDVTIDDLQTPVVDPFTNQPLLSANGEPQVEHQMLATSRNNFIYVGGLPVFYWPTIATDLTAPTYYLNGFRLKNDRVFGFGPMLDWDLFQLLGIENKPPGSAWTLSTDYFNLRGPALGTDYKYHGDTLLGIPGPYKGFFDAYGIHDTGRDNLGRDWRDLAVPDPFRGRVLARHQQRLPGEWTLTGELGLVSDRNFLEQYFELEWDTFKDESTDLDLKRLAANSSYEITAEVRPNGFVTDTQWLPRGDHFLFGQPLLFDRLSWHEHTSVGYAQMLTASSPTDPAQTSVISRLPWEANVQGARAASRHELDLPLAAGPVKVVPYLLGEAAYWGEDLTGNPLTRAFGQAGVKASLPVWRTDPTLQSELFNLNGLAHKVTFESEFLVAGSNQDMSQLPLYDRLDDNSTEFTRRQMAVRTFGQPVGTFVPTRFDERFYALRSNLQGNVAAPTEIADDLMEFRLGVNNRWQTKRGIAGQQRIVDWIVLDVNAVLFPNAARDNFHAGLGLADYGFRWHVGDRLTLLSDGFFDGFDQGLRQVTVGALMSRPEHGSFYVGFRSTEGPITSEVLTGTISYRMSEKWIATGGATYDFSSTGVFGQQFAVTRIGESFLIKVGFNYDASRNNFGATIGIEPRFLPSSRLGRVGGVAVPPAGALGLE
ncbi:MAG TPA: organic solvent tolerance protein OstA [Pirellulaceae bacterium]|nr:organic solvent tolerance protein OstA [Pirellulaceae bacterium]